MNPKLLLKTKPNFIPENSLYVIPFVRGFSAQHAFGFECPSESNKTVGIVLDFPLAKLKEANLWGLTNKNLRGKKIEEQNCKENGSQPSCLSFTDATQPGPC